MAETIKLPDGSIAPAWATEQTMKELLKTFKESRLFKKDASRTPNAPGADKDAFKEFEDKVFKLTGNTQLGALSKNVIALASNFGDKSGGGGLSKGISAFGEGLGYAAEAAGVFGPALQGASVVVGEYAKLMGKYLNVLGDAIDVGLGYSASLGDSAAVAGQAGVSLKEFYTAVSKTEGTYRALGDNAMEAAKNFGALQSSVRSAYGTFGMSNEAMASATADYVKLVAQTGLRGTAANEQAAEAFGKSMEQMRKISIATGVSFSSLQKNMKDLVASPVIIAGINKFGMTTEQATEKLAKGAAGFEAVFGKLGTDLYKQMAEAEAAGLSIINTELGAQLAPFTDLGALTRFNKMLQDGSGTAAEMAEAQRSFLSATEANLPTLRLLAQQGDAASKQMLELYNKAKSANIMTQEEMDLQKLKKRGEEQLMNVQNKIGAAYEKVTAKLFGLLEAIPESTFELLGTIFEDLGSVVGFAVDAFVVAAKVIGLILDPIMRLTKSVYGFLKWLVFPGDKTFMELVLEPWEGALDAMYEKISGIWDGIADWFSSLFDGAGILGVAVMGLVNPFLAIGAVVKKMLNWFGGGGAEGAEGVTSNPMGDASTAIMDSVARNDAGPVKAAATAKAVDSADADRRVAETTNTHLAKLAQLSEQSLDHQSTTAKNTANTADAVNNSSNNY